MIFERKSIEELRSLNSTIVRVAGLTYIIIIIIGVLNAIFIDSKLIIYDNINLTINNILGNEFLFRFGSVSILILYVTVIILSVLLYLILKSVNKNLALIAMVFRIGEALLGVTTVLISYILLGLLNNQFNATSIANDQLKILVTALLDARTTGLYLVLLLVGLGGTLFFYLFYKALYIPKILSIWGMFTYLSMLILSLISILLPDLPDMIESILFGLGTLFELTIGIWLLFKGINIQQISYNNVELR